MANVFEMAALSLDAYREKGRPALPADWRILKDCPTDYQKDGYFGSAYIRTHAARLPEIVIAHRGSDDFSDYWEDLALFLIKAVPKQCRVAMMPFVNEVIAHCDQQWGKNNYLLSHTGHSLGALLAELAFARCFARATHPESFTVTFESPGAKPFYDELVKKGEFKEPIYTCAKQHVRTFNADVDAINSLYEHVGLTYAPLHVGYAYHENKERGYPLSPDLLYFFWSFTVNDQHHMHKLYNYCQHHLQLLNTTPCDFIWPVGVEKALQYYLTYRPEGITGAAHQRYWDNYMDRCWMSRPQTQRKYNGEKNHFAADFIQKALQTAKATA